MNHAFFIALQRIAPQHLISRAIGLLAASETPFIKNTFINKFSKKYAVNMSEAVEETPLNYPSFNAFFTRALKPDARPIAPGSNTIVSPADGCISQMGNITDGRILQAKGQWFSVTELLGGGATAHRYNNGNFATVYLSPKDYHRVHMPLTGTLTTMTYIPGKLFSVNQATADNLPRLFARNERVVCEFETEFGPMAVVLVGAMIVASIETPWAGLVAPVKRAIKSHAYGQTITLNKGDEVGRFLLGSTAILLTPQGTKMGGEDIRAGSEIKMGQVIGSAASL